LSLWELPPGEAAYPYHYHLAEEELVLVLEGQPSLRTPDGWRVLQEGEVVPFLRGEQGGHQLVNRTEDTVRFLAFSTNGEPDIVLYPTPASSARSSGYRPVQVCGRCSASVTPSTTTRASSHPTSRSTSRRPASSAAERRRRVAHWRDASDPEGWARYVAAHRRGRG
jgi:hypothetical protein